MEFILNLAPRFPFVFLFELALVEEVRRVLANKLAHGFIRQLHVEVDESCNLLGFLCCCHLFFFLFFHYLCRRFLHLNFGAWFVGVVA